MASARRYAVLGCLAALGVAGAVASVSHAADPAAGKFLVAHREMRDPNFAKTVVLLLDYGPGGAMGLVINRPSPVLLSTFSSDIEGLASSTDPIYLGGPVPGESLFVLFVAEQPPEGSTAVVDRVHVTRRVDVLRSLVDADPRPDFRVFAGYAGWGPGQLDNELGRGDWHVVAADEAWIFTDGSEEVWELLIPPEPTRQAALMPR